MSSGPLPSLIVIVPLIASLFVFSVGHFRPGFCFPAVIAVLTSTLVFTVSILAMVLQQGKTIRYHLGGWDPPWGIEYSIDHLNSLILVCIAIAAFIIVLHSRKVVLQEIREEKQPQFYALVLLQLTGLLGITITGDVFNLYVLIEIASFSAYAIIGMGEKGAEFAAFRYMIFGTLGACAYLLGVGYLYILTGSLNMADLATLLPAHYGSVPFTVGLTFLLLGVGIKMGLFPLHMWLPDAYTYAPSGVSSLLAPLFTKVGAYVLIRLLLTLFDPSLSYEILPVGKILGWIGGAGILFACIMALAQSDLKRMLCYLIIAETGFVAVGVGSGTREGLIGAIFHTVNDIFMMACLFTAVSTIFEAKGSRNREVLQGLHRQLPVTVAVFLIGVFSVVGIPPLCGFFSKWYLLLGTIEAKQWFSTACLIAGSLFNTVLLFRLLEAAYFGKESGGVSHLSASSPESKSEIIPMVCLASILLLLGLFSGTLIQNVIALIIPETL